MTLSNRAKLEQLLGVKPRTQRSVHAPIKYPGSKTDSIPDLLPLLPYRDSYIEVFGGSGVVLLNRLPQKLEVFNDRFAGVTCFYRVLRDQFDDLVKRLTLLVHSREEWEWCLATWQDDTLSDLERAARWYYLVQSSFLGKGHSWARVTSSPSAVAGTIGNKLEHFPAIHARLKGVQIENLDFHDCICDYDMSGAVIYCDPPYLDVDDTSYACKMAEQDHIDLLELIMKGKGFFALSGYANELYDSYSWTKRVTWERRDRANAQAISVHNHRATVGEREMKTEVLWIKDHRV
jgi:DNA adenine methylase